MMETTGVYSTDSEMTMLRDAARRFLAGSWPAERAVVSSRNPAELRRVWGEMTRQGWLALGSEAGGMRMASVLLEELGRAACPAPLLDAFLGNFVLGQIEQPPQEIGRLIEQVQ